MKATLNGLLLPADSGAGWSEVAGVAPHRRTFRVPASLADKLIAHRTPGDSTLIIDARDEGLQKLEFKNLSIIGSGPTNSPYEVDLVVVDSRWLWKYKHVYATFNITRKTGSLRRLTSPQRATQQIVDDVGFAAYSLRGGKKAWTPLQALEYVLNKVAGPGKWQRRGLSAAKFGTLQDVTIDAPGDAALAQLLSDPAYGGAIGVYQNRLGVIVVYNRLDDSERDLLGAPPAASGIRGFTRIPIKRPAIVGEPLWSVQDRKLERPSRVDVLFERRIELRCECVERLASLGSSTIDPIRPPLYARNVLPSPEDFLHQGREIISEQWIELEFYLDFLKAKTPSGLIPLSLEVLRKGWASNVIEIWGEVDTSGLWGRRIDYIRQHYRLTWQIQKTWRDRIRELKAERLTSEDRETGARPNAAVFANYAQFNTWRSKSTRFASTSRAKDMVTNQYANKQAGGPIIGTDYTKLRPAPAFVDITDSEQGIFHFEFGRGSDNSYQVSRYIRSALEPRTIPSDDPTAANQWLQEGALEADFVASVILTADLGAPPDPRRYHKISVTPAEAGAVLPSKRVQAGSGPVLEVRVKPSILVSRHPWEDARKSAVELMLSPQGLAANMPSPQNVLGVPINIENLKDYALGIGAKVYGDHLDRAEGGLTTGLTDQMVLTGTASTVSHEADPDLGAVTKAVVPQEAPQRDVSALLPLSVRKVVDRVVDPKG